MRKRQRIGPLGLHRQAHRLKRARHLWHGLVCRSAERMRLGESPRAVPSTLRRAGGQFWDAVQVPMSLVCRQSPQTHIAPRWIHRCRRFSPRAAGCREPYRGRSGGRRHLSFEPNGNCPPSVRTSRRDLVTLRAAPTRPVSGHRAHSSL